MHRNQFGQFHVHCHYHRTQKLLGHDYLSNLFVFVVFDLFRTGLLWYAFYKSKEGTMYFQYRTTVKPTKTNKLDRESLDNEVLRSVIMAYTACFAKWVYIFVQSFHSTTRTLYCSRQQQHLNQFEVSALPVEL